MHLKTVPLIFHQTFADDFYYNVNICILLNHLQNLSVQENSRNTYLIPQLSHFLLLCLYLHLIVRIISERLFTRFDHDLAISLRIYVRYIF